MPCYHPHESGMVFDPKAEKYRLIWNIPSDRYDDPLIEHVQIPCRKCLGCREAYARQWAIRAQLEAVYFPNSSWFVTLTYDDANLPWAFDGFSLPTLRKRDWQLFMKRLRKAFGVGIRFLACGEYGEKTGRPHYHAVLFGVDFSDLRPFRNKGSNLYYTSDKMARLWPYGQHLIARYEFHTGAYVAKYLKKTGESDDAEVDDPREKTFLLASRNPALGKRYFDEHMEEILETDKICLPGGFVSNPPIYFDYLLNRDHRALSLDVKARRRFLASLNVGFDDTSDLDLYTYLRRLEEIKTAEKKLRE